MTPKRCDERLEKLIVRLHDTGDKRSFEKIAQHVQMTKVGVRKVYQRVKNPVPVKIGGKLRSTDDRTDRRIAIKSKENPKLTAPEIREELGLGNVSTRAVQRHLAEAGLFGRRPGEKPWISHKNVNKG